MTGDGLVAVLGWSTDDFISELSRCSKEALEDAKIILAVEDLPGTEERYVMLSRFGIKEIAAELQRRENLST